MGSQSWGRRDLRHRRSASGSARTQRKAAASLHALHRLPHGEEGAVGAGPCRTRVLSKLARSQSSDASGNADSACPSGHDGVRAAKLPLSSVMNGSDLSAPSRREARRLLHRAHRQGHCPDGAAGVGAAPGRYATGTRRRKGDVRFAIADLRLFHNVSVREEPNGHRRPARPISHKAELAWA